MPKRLTHQEFLNILYEKNEHYRKGEFVVVGQFEKMKSHIDCECPLHGKWSTSTPYTLLNQNVGCPKCYGTHKKTQDEFLEELNLKNIHYRNKEFKVIGIYEGTAHPIECECPIHGKWDTSRPIDLIKGGGCPKCGLLKTAMSHSYSHKDFIEKLLQNNEHYRTGEFKVIGEYVDSQSPIECECRVHGKWDSSRPGDLIKGGGCPKCGGSVKYTDAEFLQKLYELNEHYRNGEFVVRSEYKNALSYIECECPIHGIWEVKPSQLLFHGSGCPSCNKKGTSFAENYIRCALRQALPDANIPDKGDRKLLEGYEIDIPVYSYNFAVEFGSWFWHKEKYKNDIAKMELLNEKGITLFTIYDSFDGSIDLSEFENITTYNFDLAQEKNWVTLKSIVYSLLKNYKCENINWNKVRTDANELSKVISTEDFIFELKEKNKHYKNGDFKVIGEYVNRRALIECECPTHGKWEVAADNLLQGHGCPKCGGTSRMNDKEFLGKLLEKNEHYRNGEFKIVGEYTNNRSLIECECSLHGQCFSKPNNLLLGHHACSICGHNKGAKKQALTHEEFLKKLYEKNEHYKKGDFKVIGSYETSLTPIECECPIHGKWGTSTPKNLLHGGWCPKCRYLRQK